MYKNQRGSIALIALPLSLVLFVVAMSFMTWYSSQAHMRAYKRVLEDSVSLQNTVKMLMSTRQACRQNLTPGGFGTSTADVLTDTREITALSKIISGKKYDGVTVKKMNISSAVKISAKDNSFIGMLTVTYANPRAKDAERSFSLPFYFVADVTGTLTDCMATEFLSDNASVAPILGVTPTIEDFMCGQQYPDSNLIYQPGGRYCGSKNTVIGKN